MLLLNKRKKDTLSAQTRRRNNKRTHYFFSLYITQIWKNALAFCLKPIASISVVVVCATCSNFGRLLMSIKASIYALAAKAMKETYRRARFINVISGFDISSIRSIRNERCDWILVSTSASDASFFTNWIVNFLQVDDVFMVHLRVTVFQHDLCVTAVQTNTIMFCSWKNYNCLIENSKPGTKDTKHKRFSPLREKWSNYYSKDTVT